MKFYYASSINDFNPHDINNINEKIITHLKQFGVVLNEELLRKTTYKKGTPGQLHEKIHDRQIEWLKKANVVIAEVSVPSLSVGYEIGIAEEMGKPVLCLFKESDEKLPEMIKDSDSLHCMKYYYSDDTLQIIDKFIERIDRETMKVRSIKDISHDTFHHLITGD